LKAPEENDVFKVLNNITKIAEENDQDLQARKKEEKFNLNL